MQTRLYLACWMLIMLFVGNIWLGPAIAEETPKVSWRTLVKLNYETGTYPETLGQLNGTRVQVPGFAVPLHIEGSEIAELTLVPQFGMCVHVPSPPPNQMVYVKLKERVSYQDLFMRPVWIMGKLDIVRTNSQCGATGFTIANADWRPYKLPAR